MQGLQKKYKSDIGNMVDSRCWVARVNILKEVAIDRPNLVQIVLHLGSVAKVLRRLITPETVMQGLRKKMKNHSAHAVIF